MPIQKGTPTSATTPARSKWHRLLLSLYRIYYRKLVLMNVFAVCRRGLVTCGCDGDVRSWVNLMDDPITSCISEQVITAISKVFNIIPLIRTSKGMLGQDNF